MFRPFSVLVLLILITLVPLSGFGQSFTTRYVYDDNGRLKAVVSFDGQANIYDYDMAGNVSGIRQVPANFLELFSFSPHQGVPGDQVIFIGVGFGAGVTSVSFNGVSAQIVGSDLTSVIAVVPNGATTGLITIVTPNGSVNTAEPFLIKGVLINPTSASLLPGESRQFNATVFTLDPDTSVRWSVNGIEGGNTSIGTITTSGLFTAPSLPSSVTVRAMSNSDPTLFAEAAVTLRSINGLRFPVSSGVLVRREVLLQPEIPRNSAVSQGVLVNRETTAAPEVPTFNAVSKGVLVNREINTTNDIVKRGAFSAGVLVNKSVNVQTEIPQNSAVSAGVLIQRDPPNSTLINPYAAYSAGVLVNRQTSTTTEPIAYGAVSKGVFVNRDVATTPVQDQFAPISQGVLVNRFIAQTQEVPTFGAYSSGVLIRRETATTVEPNSLFVGSNGVLVMNGAIITGISPNQLDRDTIQTITISGINLSGVISVGFSIPNGGVDSLIIVSNISVNAQGTSLTATVQVGPSAAIGNRIVLVQTGRGPSLVTNPNANIVTIQ